jgi:tetratricopeptide (TPR) repeat protein
VSATTPPPSSSEPETTPEEYRQRALLFADLGRYDEAADEIAAGLAAAPADAALLATLARIHLAAEQPAEALVAADRAVAAAPEEINPLVVRAMALTDNSRYADAARVAAQVLHRWPADPYALRTGAALLSEARNGQEALNAAWEAVRLAPADAEAHLVLAVVAARLRLFDLAQRAYGEALDLDAGIGDAQRDVGIVRLERRRWAQALEGLADQATLDQPPAAPGQDTPGSPYDPLLPEPAVPDTTAPTDSPDRSSHIFSAGSVDGTSAVARPAGPVLDPSADSGTALRQAVRYGATGALVAAVSTAAMSTASAGASRVWAAMIGVLLLIAVPIWLGRRLTERLSTALARLRSRDRRLAAAVYAALFAPVLIMLYAAIAGPVPLVAAAAVAAAALLLSFRRS